MRSSLRGRCLAVVGPSGEEGGSFFTIIFGGWPCLALYITLDLLCMIVAFDRVRWSRLTKEETVSHQVRSFAAPPLR